MKSTDKQRALLIERLEAQQVLRRQFLAELEAVIAMRDLEIQNLRSQAGL